MGDKTLFPLDPGPGWELPAAPPPADEAFLRKVERLLRMGRYQQMLALLEPLERERAREGVFWAFRAIAHAELDHFDNAIADLREARLREGQGQWEFGSISELAGIAIGRARGSRSARRPKPLHARPAKATGTTPRPARTATGALPDVPVEVHLTNAGLAKTFAASPGHEEPTRALADFHLRREAHEIGRLRRFDTLLSLGAARGIDQYDFQLRTVRRVLRDFRGRALLADEVGLGKTIEACLCLEEYLQRGLVRRALVLVPPGLVGQWRDELAGKFGREAVVVDSAAARAADAWDHDGVLLTSTGLARTEPHAERLGRTRFDMVVVDEAHRLKNRSTKLWSLVDSLRSRFLLLLSATPVENDVFEIYNVLSLLRPGLFPTPAEFRRAFVEPGRRTPKDPARLRSLLREVMVRNTRALAEARLPPRFATTIRAAPTPDEAAYYADLTVAVRAGLEGGTLPRLAAGEILRAAGSRPAASTGLVGRHLGPEWAGRARSLVAGGKDTALVDLLTRRPDEKVIVFATHRETLEHLKGVVERAVRRPVVFHGSLSAAEKTATVARFAADADVLLASESGGEGFNLHFARTVVNYDLPWNPMRIEQRIGRVHRIGQQRDVFIFNLVAQGTVEEEILRVLDEKLAMFELVVGEIEAVLGRLGDDEREFADLILDAYANARDAGESRARFEVLAERMASAKTEHLRVRDLEERVFGRDLEA